MKNSLKKIITVFILVAILPVGFIIYEFASLNENERIVREIYKNQLDAILFSINQYSDDVINSWANRFSIAIADRSVRNDSISAVESLMNQLGGVEYIYFSDRGTNSFVQGINKHEQQNEKMRARLDSLVKVNGNRINRLISYNEAGFRKMELLDTVNVQSSVPVVFVLNEGLSAYSLGAMVIDLPTFIENTLGPKLQGIAQNKFIISVYQTRNDSISYSTHPNNAKVHLAGDDAQKKSFWLLPGYYVSISLIGATIGDLVWERVLTSTIILIILILILALGIVFLYKSIRREMYLAQAKSEFVSNVSHEIRTPLSLISMYAETLEMNRIGEEKKLEYQRVIAKEAARLSGIVNRILNFSQLQANKKVYQFKPVQLNDIVDGVLKSYHFHLLDKGFEVTCEKQDDLKSISGDSESITEAVVNLIDNAMKYSPEKKNILVKTGTDNRYSFVEVKDEGMGIPKKHHTEIFEQFYRAPSGDIHNTKGSGLGLTLVQKTVQAHGGKIKVESVPGEGSTFRLYFPFKQDSTS